MKKKAKSVLVLILFILILISIPITQINATTNINSKKVVTDAKKKLGVSYSRIGKCTGFVCHTMRHSKAKLKVKFPKNTYVSNLKHKMSVKVKVYKFITMVKVFF